MAETQTTDTLSGSSLNNLTDIYCSKEHNVNNYPRTAMAGGDTIPVIHGLVGALEIPSNTLSLDSHSAGVAGYARTASNVPAVGLYGVGMAAANNTNVWGGNSTASNTHSHPLPSQTGYQGCNVHGWEVDICIVPLAGGGAPNGQGLGFYSVNGSVVVPNGDFNAFHASSIDSEWDTRWNTAFNSETGAAEIALDAWPKERGNSKQSQFIYLRGRNSSGDYKAYRMWADLSGNLHMSPPDTNSGTYIENSAGTTRIQVTSGGVGLFGDVEVNGTPIQEINPAGAWANFTPTFTGFATGLKPSDHSNFSARYKRIGNTVHVNYDCLFGTSNSTSLTCSLPVPSADVGTSYVRNIPARVRDNSNVVNGWGLIEFDNDASTFTVYKDAGGAGWTNSGGKGFRASFSYECED